MDVQMLDMPFSICKVAELTPAHIQSPFSFAAKTDEENSLVCPTCRIPADTVERDDG